jgi:N-acyl-D-amino-acid deacylase
VVAVYVNGRCAYREGVLEVSAREGRMLERGKA